jgi:hypothetical protein
VERAARVLPLGRVDRAVLAPRVPPAARVERRVVVRRVPVDRLEAAPLARLVVRRVVRAVLDVPVRGRRARAVELAAPAAP